MSRTELERLTEAVERYFTECDATRERIELRNGGFSERQIPYTLYGLARATGLTPDALKALYHGSEQGKKARLIRNAVARIAAYTLERALLGELVYQVALKTLESLDGEGLHTEDGIRITMDAETERYAI